MEKESQQKFNEILEIVTFIKNEGATKEDLKAVENRLGQRIGNLEKRFDNLEQRFDNLELRFDNLEQDMSRVKTHLFSIDNGLKDIKREIERLEIKTQDDANAFAEKIVNLVEDVKKLRQNIKHLQLT